MSLCCSLSLTAGTLFGLFFHKTSNNIICLRSSWQSFCQLLLQVQWKAQLDLLMEESGYYGWTTETPQAHLPAVLHYLLSTEVFSNVHLKFPCWNASLLLLVLSLFSCLWVWMIACPHSLSSSLPCLCSCAKWSLCLLSHKAKLLIFPWIPPRLRAVLHCHILHSHFYFMMTEALQCEL